MLIPWKERLEEQLLVVPRCKCRVLRNHIPPNPNPTTSHLAPEGRYFCLGIHGCPPPGRSKRAAALDSSLPLSPCPYIHQFSPNTRNGYLGCERILLPNAPLLLFSAVLI